MSVRLGTLARQAGIEVPVHGLVRAVDGSWVYFIRRFDRTGRQGRVHVEDLILTDLIDSLQAALPLWQETIGRSYLSSPRQLQYLELLADRAQRLFF